MKRIISRITIIMLLAGLLSAATYFAVPQSSETDRMHPQESDSEMLVFTGFDGDEDGAPATPADSGAPPAGERRGHHSEFSLAGGLMGIVKNGSLFVVAMLGAIGIRRFRGAERGRSWSS